MPVVVIDTIKPKNNLTFPIVEDVDVLIKASGARLSEVVANMATEEQITALENALAGKASIESVEALTSLVNTKASAADLTALSATVEGKASQTDLASLQADVADKADAADLTALEAEVDTKADSSDLTSATANLQAQIDNIVTPVTQDAEVQNARVGADGTSYNTLKARLDAESEYLSTSLSDIQTILNAKDYYKILGTESGVLENGAVTPSDSWKTVNGYIPYDGTPIIITGSTATFFYACYTTDNVSGFISQSSSSITGSVALRNFPEGTRYVRFSFFKTFTPTITIGENAIDRFDKEIDLITEDVDTVLTTDSILARIPFMVGGITATDGETYLPNRTDLCFIIHYLDINNDFVFIPNGYNFTCIWYNANKQYLGYNSFPGKTGIIRLRQLKEQAPSGTAFVRLNAKKDDSSTITTPEIIYAFGLTANLISDPTFISWAQKAVTDKTTGNRVYNTDRVTSIDFIPIWGLQATIATGFSYSICLYNADKQVIPNSLLNWLTESVDYEYLLSKFPDACFIKINIRKNDDSAITITEANTAATITILDYRSIISSFQPLIGTKGFMADPFNIDDYQNSGSFLVSSVATNTSPLSGKAFVLEIQILPSLYGAKVCTFQRITDVSNGACYIRFLNANQIWGEWQSISMNDYMQLEYSSPIVCASKINKLRSRTTNQDIALYKGTIIEADTGFIKINGTKITITNGHGNNCNFGTTLHGDYPYLYCPAWDENINEIYVNQITNNSAELVDTITISDMTTGYLNAVVDEAKGKIYCFVADDPYVGNITFIVTDMTGNTISTQSLSVRIPIIQGMTFYDNKIYLTAGSPNTGDKPTLYVFDTSGNIVSKTSNIEPYVEIEGIDFDTDGKLYIANINNIYS